MKQVLLSLLLGVAALMSALMSATAFAAGEQQTVDEAKALGKAQAQSQNTALKNGTATTAVTSTNPNYTATPPQTQYYATKDLVSPAQAQVANCQATPTDPTCAGVAQGTAKRPSSTVTSGDPALIGQTVAANPTLILGEIAQTYNACSIGGLPLSAGAFNTSTCSLDTGPWSSHNCQKSLTVQTQTKYSCNAGSQFEVVKVPMNDGGHIEVHAICDPLAGDTITFEMHGYGQWGACDGWLSYALDLSKPQPQGQNVPATLPPLRPNGAKGCEELQVFSEGQGCSNKVCQLNFHFVQGLLFTKKYSCTAPNDLTADKIQFSGYSAPGDPQTLCYAPYTSEGAAAPLVGGWGVGNNTWAYWAESGPANYNGYEVQGSPHYVAPFSFPQPVLTTVPGSTLTDTCSQFEAITSLLPPDGVNAATLPIMPSIGAVDAPQCVRSSSVCLEGAGTKIIDGVPVTKECWNYANTFECTQLVKPSTCADPLYKACDPRGAAACAKDDGAGHCVQALAKYDCKAGDAQYTPAINCGNQSYCAGGSCYDTAYAPNQDFAYTVSQMEAHAEAGADFDEKSMQIFKGTDDRCSRDNVGINDCCGGSSVTSCSDAEKTTVQKRDAGKCVQVGDYCSGKNIFGCYETTETYCCFSSLLARLVQEQGRAQMSKSWGAPKTPDCTGFSPDALAALDWSKFDFTEFYATISPKPLDTPAATQGATDAQQTCYWGSGRC